MFCIKSGLSFLLFLGALHIDILHQICACGFLLLLGSTCIFACGLADCQLGQCCVTSDLWGTFMTSDLRLTQEVDPVNHKPGHHQRSILKVLHAHLWFPLSTHNITSWDIIVLCNKQIWMSLCMPRVRWYLSAFGSICVVGWCKDGLCAWRTLCKMCSDWLATPDWQIWILSWLAAFQQDSTFLSTDTTLYYSEPCGLPSGDNVISDT